MHVIEFKVHAMSCPNLKAKNSTLASVYSIDQFFLYIINLMSIIILCIATARMNLMKWNLLRVHKNFV